MNEEALFRAARQAQWGVALDPPELIRARGRHLRRRRGALVVFSCVIVVALVGVGLTYLHRRIDAPVPAAAQVGHVAFGTPIPWPAGYDPATILVSDGVSEGPWWWANSATTSAFFHLDDSGQIVAFPIAQGDSKPPTTIAYGLAADAHNVVLAVSDQLFVLEQSSGQVQTMPLTLPTRDPVAPGGDAVVPSSVALHGTTAAVTFDHGSAVSLIDLSTGAQLSVPLPRGIEANSSAYTSDGTLVVTGLNWDDVDLAHGVGAQVDRLLFLSGTGWQSTPSKTFWLTGNGSEVIAGGQHLDMVVAGPNGFSLSAISSENVSTAPHGSLDQNGQLYVPLRDSILVTSTRSHTSRSYKLPNLACPGASRISVPPPPRGAIQPSPTTSPNQTCLGTLNLFTATATGSLWGTSAITQPGILRITLSR